MPPHQPDAVRLATLVHVARHGSLTGAARVMGVTTSAVSQQMSALESDCGVRLIDRQSRGVTLTGAGMVLLERAEEVVRQLDETGATMAQLSGELAGPVRVAAIASGAASIVLPAVRALARSAPAVSMSVTTMEPAASLEALIDGTVDVALIDVYDHVPLALPSQLLVEEVLTEPLVLVSAPDAVLPRRPRLIDLKDCAWVIPPVAAACGAATRHACRSAGFEPRVTWVTDDLLLLVAAVSRGEGVALLPRRAVADSVAPVTLRHLAAPSLSRRMLLVARQATGLRPIVRACLDAVHHVSGLESDPFELPPPGGRGTLGP
jgi:DNA-binding transcriptional LysR family regulator